MSEALQEKLVLSTTGFLTFQLGEELYGVDITKVQEIRHYESPTRIANTPEFIKGVVNLRGNIIPIVDLRMRFKLAQVTYNAFTVVIILSLLERTVGIVVDAVSDVVNLTDSEISALPDLVSSIETKYLMGLADVGGKTAILINIEHLMTSQEMQLIDENQDQNLATQADE